MSLIFSVGHTHVKYSTCDNQVPSFKTRWKETYVLFISYNNYHHMFSYNREILLLQFRYLNLPTAITNRLTCNMLKVLANNFFVMNVVLLCTYGCLSSEF